MGIRSMENLFKSLIRTFLLCYTLGHFNFALTKNIIRATPKITENLAGIKPIAPPKAIAPPASPWKWSLPFSSPSAKKN